MEEILGGVLIIIIGSLLEVPFASLLKLGGEIYFARFYTANNFSIAIDIYDLKLKRSFGSGFSELIKLFSIDGGRMTICLGSVRF